MIKKERFLSPPASPPQSVLALARATYLSVHFFFHFREILAPQLSGFKIVVEIKALCNFPSKFSLLTLPWYSNEYKRQIVSSGITQQVVFPLLCIVWKNTRKQTNSRILIDLAYTTC